MAFAFCDDGIGRVCRKIGHPAEVLSMRMSQLATSACYALQRTTPGDPMHGSPSFIPRYWPAAGDTTLGVAKVLLLFGAGASDFVVLFVLLGKPLLGLAAMPLPEWVVPGVPYPPVAPFT